MPHNDFCCLKYQNSCKATIITWWHAFSLKSFKITLFFGWKSNFKVYLCDEIESYNFNCSTSIPYSYRPCCVVISIALSIIMHSSSWQSHDNMSFFRKLHKITCFLVDNQILTYIYIMKYQWYKFNSYFLCITVIEHVAGLFQHFQVCKLINGYDNYTEICDFFRRFQKSLLLRQKSNFNVYMYHEIWILPIKLIDFYAL